ncbi:P-loop containing nucleoside triphosphate hydrolase protein [Mrakia frigida]|uniref:P-loop containing nucleoside triphosphate hydrolase protein n=1 Tax=Mrakia frigida TaxID=29902 RepID=UPI003FCC16AE
MSSSPAPSSSRKHPLKPHKQQPTPEDEDDEEEEEQDIKPPKRARKATPPPSEDEEEQDQDDSPSKGRRPAVNGHGGRGESSKAGAAAAAAEKEGAQEEEEDDDVVDDGNGTMNDLSDELKARLAQRGEDGYLPGAVVRVAFRNFLTYDWAEFFPGPHLNMIIGPNGTGKSTIVCGIAIGLGWSPKVLGRADLIAAFLKYGATKGFTEIELKSPAGPNGEVGRNVVIKREILKESEKSRFWLNGEAATAKVIRDKVVALNIQIGNLCSFLPQDKVSSFATMTPQELLRQTQKAAGPAKMTDWHTDLIRLGKDWKDMDHNLEVKKAELDRKKASNQRLEGDVNDARERERLATEILFLERMIPFAEYNSNRIIWEEYKRQRFVAHSEFKRASAMVEPFRELIGAFEDREKDAQLKVSDIQSSQTKIDKTQITLIDQIMRQETAKENIEGRIDNVKKKAIKRVQDIATQERTIEKLENDWEQRVEPGSKEQLEDKKRAAKHDGAEIEDQFNREILNEDRNIRRTITEKQNEIKRQKEKIDQLSQVSYRRMQNLQKWPDSQDIVGLVNVIRKDKEQVSRGHASIFKMEVFEPPCLSVDVTDPKIASLVEACISGTQMRTVVVQCEEDYQTIGSFTDSPNNVIKAQLKKLHYTKIDKPYRPGAGPVDRDQLRDLGFDGYAIDFVKAPDPVKAFLEIHCNLHRSAVSRRKIGDGGISWDRVSQTDLRSYVAGDTKYATSVSRYGNQAKSSGTTQINAARSFAGTVDEDAISEANRLIETAEKEIHRTNKMLAELKARGDELNLAKSAVDQKLEEIKQELETIKKVEVKNATTLTKLADARRKLQTLQNAPSEEDQKARYQVELKEIIKAKLKLDLKFKDCALKAGKAYHSLVDQQLELLQVETNRRAVSELSEIEQEAEAIAGRAYNAADKKFRAQKATTKDLLLAAQDQLEALDNETRETFMQRKEDHAEMHGGSIPEPNELQDKKTQLEADLDGLGGEDPAVIQKYERAKAEIARVERDYTDMENKERTVAKAIKTVRAKWVPELQKLVTNFNKKFSAAMDSLDDRGEIRIREHEDYAEWAIEILVSFRATDKMQILTATHQSGGERSLSTIMYLMSLIELSNAPFSLVDEINQGMDTRAERAVHNRMVDVTCAPNAGQFFLLTPKLLTDLHYHERMRVLVICNGEVLPEREPRDTRGKKYLNYVLERYKRKNNIAPR